MTVAITGSVGPVVLAPLDLPCIHTSTALSMSSFPASLPALKLPFLGCMARRQKPKARREVRVTLTQVPDQQTVVSDVAESIEGPWVKHTDSQLQ